MRQVEIDAEAKNTREINRELKTLAKKYDRIILKNPNAKHYLAAGLISPVELVIDGSAGYFVGTMVDKPCIKVKGNVGWFAGDNMTQGKLIIEGSAGDGAGQGIYGGTIVVKNDAGSRTGEIMKHGTVIVGGNSGFMSGIFMMGGRIIVLGDIGEDAGESIIRGTIYVLGDIKSLGKNAQTLEINEADITDLKEILPTYGFQLEDDQYNQFKKIVPRSKRPFYGPESEEG